MAYQIPSKKKREKQDFYTEKEIIQNKINGLLFAENPQYRNPKLLTIIVRQDKEHFFHFLKNETEFEIKGKWHNKEHKLFNEENSEIVVQYFDDDKHTKTKQLKKLFENYNKKYVKEDVLYTTTTPLEMTTLN